jgi:hypothetical protein
LILETPVVKFIDRIERQFAASTSSRRLIPQAKIQGCLTGIP